MAKSAVCHSGRLAEKRPTRSPGFTPDRKSTRLNSSHSQTSYAVFCSKKIEEYLQDVHNLYADITAGTDPSVAFVRPLEQVAVHPPNAAIALYDKLARNLVIKVRHHPD